MILLPSSFTLFPYTTLFRSSIACCKMDVIVGFSSAMNGNSSMIKTTFLSEIWLDRYRKAASQSANEPKDDPRWKSTRLNSSHVRISYAVFCLKKKKKKIKKI